MYRGRVLKEINGKGSDIWGSSRNLVQVNQPEIYKDDASYNSCVQIGGYSYCHQRHTSSVRLGLEDTAEEREQSL